MSLRELEMLSAFNFCWFRESIVWIGKRERRGREEHGSETLKQESVLNGSSTVVQVSRV
jgi:hypothetical protein